MAAAKTEEPKSLFVATLQDVNKLIDNMQAKTKGTCIGPSFANLTEEWRKMRFSNIFNRSTQEEIMDFTPVTYLATKINMLPPTEMERRLYAVLVLYALYIRQPCNKICKVCKMLKFHSTIQNTKTLISDSIDSKGVGIFTGAVQVLC
jgi:Small nuclear RNA activating complex (SNAPc), subunit 1